MAKVTTEPDIFDRMGARWEDGLGEGWETSPVFLVVRRTPIRQQQLCGLQVPGLCG